VFQGVARCDMYDSAEKQARRNEENEERSETTFVFFVSSWLLFHRIRESHAVTCTTLRKSKREETKKTKNDWKQPSCPSYLRGCLSVFQGVAHREMNDSCERRRKSLLADIISAAVRTISWKRRKSVKPN